MPVKRCQLNGKDGWKWGDEGKCYTEGSDAANKQKAIAQGRAVEASKNSSKKPKPKNSKGR